MNEVFDRLDCNLFSNFYNFHLSIFTLGDLYLKLVVVFCLGEITLDVEVKLLLVLDNYLFRHLNFSNVDKLMIPS